MKNLCPHEKAFLYNPLNVIDGYHEVCVCHTCNALVTNASVLANCCTEHVFCFTCLTAEFQKKKTCPKCFAAPSGDTGIVLVKAIDALVDSMTTRCPNQGCPFVSTLVNVEEHVVGSCEHRCACEPVEEPDNPHVQCLRCSWVGKPEDAKAHASKSSRHAIFRMVQNKIPDKRPGRPVMYPERQIKKKQPDGVKRGRGRPRKIVEK